MGNNCTQTTINPDSNILLLPIIPINIYGIMLDNVLLLPINPISNLWNNATKETQVSKWFNEIPLTASSINQNYYIRPSLDHNLTLTLQRKNYTQKIITHNSHSIFHMLEMTRMSLWHLQGLSKSGESGSKGCSSTHAHCLCGLGLGQSRVR